MQRGLEGGLEGRLEGGSERELEGGLAGGLDNSTEGFGGRVGGRVTVGGRMERELEGGLEGGLKGGLEGWGGFDSPGVRRLRRRPEERGLRGGGVWVSGDGRKLTQEACKRCRRGWRSEGYEGVEWG